MSWDGPTAAWWRTEVEGDPAYRRDVDPMAADLIGTPPAGLVIDLGCGNGRLLPRFGSVGVDSSRDLVLASDRQSPTILADIRRLPLGSDSCQLAYAVLVIEHLAEVAEFFAEAARVVAPGGALVVVVNHPIYTAPGAGPFLDPEDGEVLWRWGSYFDEGAAAEPAGAGSVVFHHRSLGDLLTSAADAGWHLERLVERALSPGGDPLLGAQVEVPRLLGARWRR